MEGRMQRGRSRGRGRGRTRDDDEPPRPGTAPQAAQPPHERRPGTTDERHEQPSDRHPGPGTAGVAGRGRAHGRGQTRHQAQQPTAAPEPGAEGGEPDVGGRTIGRGGLDVVSNFEKLSLEERKTLDPGQPYFADNYRPDDFDKRGSQGARILLKTNFFRLQYDSEWLLHHYHVAFSPPQENRRVRMSLVLQKTDIIGEIHAFDGANLYLPIQLESPREYYVNLLRTGETVKVTLTRTCSVPSSSRGAITVLNIIWRKILKVLGFKQIQRHHFNTTEEVNIPAHRLTIIPGFQTAINPFERQMLLEMDLTHKILRMDTVLDHIREQSREQRRYNGEDLLNQIVLTRYNNKTYKIADVLWNKSVRETFDRKRGPISYVDYFKECYDLKITDMSQPMLAVRPTEKDLRRGDTEVVYLVPELCVLTGLTEKARSNFNLMIDVAVHTKVAPDGRASKYLRFMHGLRQDQKAYKMLTDWRITVDPDMLKIYGRRIPGPQIVMRDGRRERNVPYQLDDADWNSGARNMEQLISIPLRKWIVVYSRNLTEACDSLLKYMRSATQNMKMQVNSPQRITLDDDRTESFMSALRQTVDRDTNLVLCIIPDRKDRYDAIKKFCCVDNAIPSQVVVGKSLRNARRVPSLATKVAMQINCKLGGVPWRVDFQLRDTMVIGIDTYHDSRKKGRSCGGIVATMNEQFTQFYSLTTHQDVGQELNQYLYTVMTAILKEYIERNGFAPKRVIVYRDGVGDGQLDMVKVVEVDCIKKALKKVSNSETDKIELFFVVVKKRVNARFFAKGNVSIDDPSGAQSAKGRGQAGSGRTRVGCVNPFPGTVVDDVVTKPTWYDFFLISQSVRQGTVTPTHYNVLHNGVSLSVDQMQELAYKFTHCYYNWQGTIRVPAPCMYAHKLAFLGGQSLHTNFSPPLCDKLFFL